MPTEMLTKREHVSPAPPAPAVDPDAELRAWARKHVERVHKLKRDIAIYVLGMAALTSVWVLVEWQDNGGFERWSNNSQPGDWDPWILAVGGIWALSVVGLFAVRAVRDVCERPTDAR